MATGESASSGSNLEGCACGRKSKQGCLEAAEQAESRLSNKSNSSDSDVWGSSDGELDGEASYDVKGDDMYSRDLEAVKRRQENKGYLDGLTDGKQEGLQTGFDEGYPSGAQLGALVGSLVAKVIYLSAQGTLDEHTKEEILEELKIDKVLDVKYFDNDLGIPSTSGHPIILKWTKYLDNLNS